MNKLSGLQMIEEESMRQHNLAMLMLQRFFSFPFSFLN